jgi:hypothetical protein
MSHILWMTVAYAQDIEVTGMCPGTLDVTVTGATANGQIVVVAGDTGGSGVLAGGACAGTSVDVGAPELRAKRTADAAGAVTLNPTVPTLSCGRSLQGVDMTTCATTLPAQIPACADNDLDGITGCDGDCDDADSAVNPISVEVCGDGLDNDCSGTDRSCSPIGEFQVADGPIWGDDPPVASCVDTCARLFGGSRDRYHCSVDPLVLDFTAFVSGWGDGTFCTTPAAEDFSKEDPYNPGYNCGSFGCAYSAYVVDWCFSGETNYCWEH